MIWLAAGPTAARAGARRRPRPTPKRTSAMPTGSPIRRARRPLSVAAGTPTVATKRRASRLREAGPYSTGVRTGRRAEMGCRTSRRVLGGGVPTGVRRCTPSLRGTVLAEAGAATRTRPRTTRVGTDRGTETARVDARTARDRELTRTTGGALRARPPDKLFDPAATDGWGGAWVAGGSGGGSACGARGGRRLSGSR
jgi:hypothetical protein